MGRGLDTDTLRRLEPVLTRAIDDLTDEHVTSVADLEVMLGLERAKDAAGCSEVTCYADLVRTLAAPHVVSGSLSHTGDTLSVALNMYDSPGHSRSCIAPRWK